MQWTECQLSSGDDRYPDIAVADGVVHVALARHDAGGQGIASASSSRVTPSNGCGRAQARRGSGRDVKALLDGGMVTIVRNAGSRGVHFTRPT